MDRFKQFGQAPANPFKETVTITISSYWLEFFDNLVREQANHIEYLEKTIGELQDRINKIKNI